VPACRKVYLGGQANVDTAGQRPCRNNRLPHPTGAGVKVNSPLVGCSPISTRTIGRSLLLVTA
jgi:hypothetical protein